MAKKICCALLILFASNATAVTTPVAAANNDFGFSLYKQMALKAQDNVLISPYSIYGALAIAYAGAGSETKAEFEKVLNIKDPAAFHQALADSIKSLNDRDGKGFSILIANALWVEEQAKILARFSQLTNKYYRASQNQISSADPKGSADKINAWVADKTKDKITNIVSAQSIDGQTKLVITNAIYFKGKWQEPFEKAETLEENFTPFNGVAEKTMMMHQQKHFLFAETDGLKFLELPYASDDKAARQNLSMILILPNQAGKVNFKALENNLSQALLEKFFASRSRTEVVVSLPKFKVETPAVLLNEPLQATGLKTAFTSQADFSGITGDKQFYISQVIHKATIDVNEEGTEAAAATAIMMPTMAVMNPHEPQEFKADRPFIYMIYDNQTGLVLFIGKLLKPY